MTVSEQAKYVFELLRSANEGMDYIMQCCNRGEISEALFIQITDLIAEACNKVCDVINSLDLPKEYHRINEIQENIVFYEDKLKNGFDSEPEVFANYVFNHYHSLLRIFCAEVAYVFEDNVIHSEYPDFYPDAQPVDHAEIEQLMENAPIKVSVVLLAYNKLDYTKKCLGSILNYTKDVEHELILVDNGSTDGTLSYFNSIPGATVIHLEKNLGLVKGFNIGLMAAKGKYTAAVCNDFIFPHKWLYNLMQCIESDKNIGYVSPGATYISNLQQINYKFIGEPEFYRFAEKYNQTDSHKWEERVVLLPNVLCCPTALLNRIGFYDTRYYYGEFLDDDISFKIRRAGYKLIYCGDTITHHFGSVTTSADHSQNSSIEKGRSQFSKKYNLDAWNDARMSQMTMCSDYSKMNNVKSILSIGARCGASLLHVRNNIWKQHKIMPTVTAFESDSKYKIDLETVCDKVYINDRIEDFLNTCQQRFDLVLIERPLNEIGIMPDKLFQNLSHILAPNGFVLCSITNSAAVDRLIALMTNSSNKYDYTINLSSTAVIQLAVGHDMQCIQNIIIDNNLSPVLADIMNSFQKAVQHYLPEAKKIQLNEIMSAYMSVFLFELK